MTFIMPFDGEYPVTSDFQSHIAAGGARAAAAGCDWGLPTGVHLKACEAGVVKSGTDSYGANYINLVSLDGQRVWQYVHMLDFGVPNGTTVSQGQFIGRSDNTGWSTGPHLHLALIINGQRVDPVIYINKGMFSKGAKIKVLGATNVREGSGVNYPIQAVAQPGAIGQVVGDATRVVDGYTWVDVQFINAQGWMVVNALEVSSGDVTNTDGSKPTPPTPPGPSCEEQVNQLKAENAELKRQIDSLKSPLEVRLTVADRKVTSVQPQ